MKVRLRPLRGSRAGLHASEEGIVRAGLARRGARWYAEYMVGEQAGEELSQ